MLALWGKTETVIGRKHTEIITDPEAAKYHQLLKEIYQTGISYSGSESRNLSTGEKGNWLHINFSYQPIKNNSGQVNSILVIADDVTESIQSKKENQRISEQFETAVNAAQIGFGILTRLPEN